MRKLKFFLQKIAQPENLVITTVYMILFTLLNLLFSWLNNVLIKSPVFLDSIFTAVCSVLLGPFWGVLTGLFTNLGQEVIYGFNGLFWPFALCNISTGLIIGLMNSNGFFTKGIHVTVAILLVTLSNAILGSLVAYLMMNGDSGVQVDLIVSALTETGVSLFSATFWARIPSNLIDKMIAVYIAFGVKRIISEK